MLLKRQKALLESYVATLPLFVATPAFDEFPQYLRYHLQRVKAQETLWCDAERYVGDLLAARKNALR